MDYIIIIWLGFVAIAIVALFADNIGSNSASDDDGASHLLYYDDGCDCDNGCDCDDD